MMIMEVPNDQTKDCSVCVNAFSFEYSEAKLKNAEEESRTRVPTFIKTESELEPCVEEIIRREELAKLLSKWERLKRVKEIYEEQVVKKKTECFRAKILRHMKYRIAKMPTEVRNLWLTKLIRLAFLTKLNELKKLKEKRRDLFLEKLDEAKGPERYDILFLMSELESVFNNNDLDDVDQMLELKKAKKELKHAKAQQLQLKIRLRRIKKINELNKQEEEKFRKERVKKIKDIIAVKKNWQEEVIKKVDTVAKNLVEDLARLKNKEEWYLDMMTQIERELEQAEQDEEDWKRNQEIALKLKEEMEMEKMKRKKKLEELEMWKKEKNIRLWKLEKVKQFQDFLDNRQNLAEADENATFKKIFKKLGSSEKETVMVDPWAMKPKINDLTKEIEKKKRISDWIRSIIASSKHRVIRNVKLKKYLQIMDTPQIDRIFYHATRLKSLQYFMIIVRGRIMRNTFPDNQKKYIATTFGPIVGKAKLDIRDIDPTDVLFTIQITTTKHDLYLTCGDEHLLVAQQIIPRPEVPCQEDESVLCLTKEDRDKLLQLIQQRQQSRKVIKEVRQTEYEAFLSRKTLDDAWMSYLKKAYPEADRDLTKCFRAEDEQFKLDLQPEPTSEKDKHSVKGLWTSGMPGMSEEQIKDLIFGNRKSSSPKEVRVKLTYEQAMAKRTERLLNAVRQETIDASTGPSGAAPLYYTKQPPSLKQILNREKAVRPFLDKDLPTEEEF